MREYDYYSIWSVDFSANPAVPPSAAPPRGERVARVGNDCVIKFNYNINTILFDDRLPEFVSCFPTSAIPRASLVQFLNN